MSIVDELRESWSWIGFDPVAVVGENDFGNLIIEDDQGRYWRLCPEECDCRLVAANRQELDALSTDQEFLEDWYMRGLVALAREKCGPLPEGRKYCLKIPGILGGEYGGDNIGTVPLLELVAFSGNIARQLQNLPDGAAVRLTVVD